MLYADDGISFLNLRFENDVKVDGTQTIHRLYLVLYLFENDVKVDGSQTNATGVAVGGCLRMM